MENLKQDDLQTCLLCSLGMMHAVDGGAVQRQHGLEMSMGAAAPLARIMGPNDDLAIGVSDVGGLICQECFLGALIAVVWEAAGAAAHDSDHAEGSTA